MTRQLVLQLFVAAVMLALTLVTHLYGLRAIEWLRMTHRRRPILRLHRVHRMTAVFGFALGLVALHGIEILQYTLLYLAVGALPDLESALYFSITSYSTVGYGDVVLPPDWRVLGSLEAVNGILLLGWSTAFLVTVIQQDSEPR